MYIPNINRPSIGLRKPSFFISLLLDNIFVLLKSEIEGEDVLKMMFKKYSSIENVKCCITNPTKCMMA